ncbi:MAG: hypothetical protein K9M36_02710 [Candidatus Pacebacteria bacterium]|nr:hypothetical protein [Candidatus Paceibacterota bacterium]
MGKGGKHSPAIKGKELLGYWQETVTAQSPYGDKGKLQELLGFKERMKTTWNKAGCSEACRDILAAIAHYELDVVPA